MYAAPVQARHHQGVAGPNVVQARAQLGPVGALAGQLVGIDPDAAGLAQSALLPVKVLLTGRDPGVADQGTGEDGRLGRELVGETWRGRGRRRHLISVRKRS